MIKLIKYDVRLNDDIEKVRALSPDKYRYFNKDKFSSPLNLASAVITDDDKVIGAGFLKLTSEAIIILDPNLPKRVRAGAIDEIFSTGRMKAEQSGLDGIHAFTYDSPSFDKVLVHRYNFVDAGTAFFLEL